MQSTEYTTTLEPAIVLSLYIPGPPQDGHRAYLFVVYEGPQHPRQFVRAGQRIALQYHPWQANGYFTQLYTTRDQYALFGWRALDHPTNRGELIVAVPFHHLDPRANHIVVQNDLCKCHSYLIH
jgi:hypothetical protein